jgi:L-ascorbate metabolism protein UlaG (beta-lactamase superfamily)
MIGPKLAIPIHWGTFALPWARDGASDRPAREFSELAAKLAPGVEVRLLLPGESTEL